MARVLIVEDEGILAFCTQRDLDELGHEVVAIVDNGGEAIAIAEREKPDVILMDIVLKGNMDGIETAGTISGRGDSRIIFMTAYTDEATLETVRSTGHAAILYKPFELFQLKDALDKALQPD